MLNMEEVAPEPPYPRWTGADRVELMLLCKKLPDGPRDVIRAAVEDQPAPTVADESVRYLDNLCDAFYRAPLVVLDGATLRLNVEDREWVRTVIDR
jgi:hypothetical protein